MSFRTKPDKIILLPDVNCGAENPGFRRGLEQIRTCIEEQLSPGNGVVLKSARGYFHNNTRATTNEKQYFSHIAPRKLGWQDDRLLTAAFFDERNIIRCGTAAHMQEVAPLGFENALQIHMRCRVFVQTAMFGGSRSTAPVCVFAQRRLIVELIRILWSDEEIAPMARARVSIGYVLFDQKLEQSKASSLGPPAKHQYRYLSHITVNTAGEVEVEHGKPLTAKRPLVWLK